MSAATVDVTEVSTRIVEEAFEEAKASAGVPTPKCGPVYLHVNVHGGWQIHSTSFMLTVDASVPLTTESTRSVHALAAAVTASFAKRR
jgi:hypothetical protein